MTEPGIGTFSTTPGWTVRPGDEGAIAAARTAFARWTAEGQPGAMTGVLRDVSNPVQFSSIDPWRDRESAKAWRGTSQSEESFARFRDLCSAIEPQSPISVASSGRSA